MANYDIVVSGYENDTHHLVEGRTVEGVNALNKLYAIADMDDFAGDGVRALMKREDAKLLCEYAGKLDAMGLTVKPPDYMLGH